MSGSIYLDNVSLIMSVKLLTKKILKQLHFRVISTDFTSLESRTLTIPVVVQDKDGAAGAADSDGVKQQREHLPALHAGEHHQTKG